MQAPSPSRLGPALLVMACLGAAVPLPVWAQDDPIAANVARLSADIEDVRVVGNWTDIEGRTGVYRIVVSRTGSTTITARMFVQWIAYPAGTDSGQVMAAIEIESLRELKANVVDYTFENGANELAIYMTVSRPGDTDKPYEAIIRAPDDYKFHRQGN